MPYIPLKGNAGTIKFKLANRSNGSLIKEIVMDVFNYSEELAPSQFNESFENVNYELTQDYYGDRQSVKFTLVNTNYTADYRKYMLFVIQMINDTNNNPDTYKLSIYYRYPSEIYIIDDAEFIGNIGLKEMSESANTSQSIDFEFREKTINPNIMGLSLFHWLQTFYICQSEVN